MTINESRNEIIKEFESKINDRINQDYNSFYIQQYDDGVRIRYGVIFNGLQVALCKDFDSLEQVINTIVFFLDGGLTQ